MHARGIFNYDFGLMPYPWQMTVVVGNPIEVPYVAQPTEAEIDVRRYKRHNRSQKTVTAEINSETSFGPIRSVLMPIRYFCKQSSRVSDTMEQP
ncbi:hypothetical protein V1517DRAFT_319354 [Lipomyces orientalis]|uniref:Uncharacterized protein n=1 Tax=Lipomyces orientalis TaxID=1233043 RepID=A0ACC3TSR0_9ASCO